MIQTHSKDPDVAEAAAQAKQLIDATLAHLPAASSFDYGGHQLTINAYDLCQTCTVPIAEAQAAVTALHELVEQTTDETIREHVALAAKLMQVEAEAAILRAELHNGHGTESILNSLLGFQYDRKIFDDYQHSHHGGNQHGN